MIDAQTLPVPGATVTAHRPAGRQDHRHRCRRSVRGAVSHARPARCPRRAQGFKRCRAEERDGWRSVRPSACPISMEVGALSETVRGQPPRSRSSTRRRPRAARTVSSELLQQIPLGRTLSSTIYLAPGVSKLGDRRGPPIRPIAGGSGLDNQHRHRRRQRHQPGLRRARVVLDRLRIAWQRDAVRFHAGQVQVKTGGYEAEFGQATGGVVNVITKSGSNVARGSAFSTCIRSGWKQPRLSTRASTAACRP